MRKVCFLLLLPCVLLTSGCEKYLDVKSANNLAVPNTLEDLQALLDDEAYMNERRTPSYVQISCDDYFLPQNRIDRLNEERFKMYTWQKHDHRFPNDVSSAYTPIFNANFCLEILEDIPRTPQNAAQWEEVKGAALFYRAYYHLKMLWAFAPAYDPIDSKAEKGIPLRLSSDFNERGVRSSVDEGYMQVIRDTESALEHLPDRTVLPSRPSKVAAHGLLARIYLSMRMYNEARQYAAQCLALHNDLIDFNKPADGINISATVPFTKFTRETIFYSTMTAYQSFHLPTADAMVDTLLYDSYDERDLRKQAYFLSRPSYYRFKGSFSANPNYQFTGISSGEVYLILSECQARTGDLGEAIATLGHLLQHRYLPNSDFQKVSVDDGAARVLEWILLHRRKELLYRGLRWADIKRLNKEGYNLTLTRNIEGEIFTLEANSEGFVLTFPVDLDTYY